VRGLVGRGDVTGDRAGEESFLAHINFGFLFKGDDRRPPRCVCP